MDILSTFKKHEQYIQALEAAKSRNWKKWQEGASLLEIKAALEFKPWLLDRPSLNLTKIEEKAGLPYRSLYTLTNKDTILLPEHMRSINPVLAPFGWLTVPEKCPIKQFILQRQELLPMAKLEKEVGVAPYIIENHVNKNWKMSHDTHVKCMKILPKYGYSE